ncbi:hypothetical protein EF879_22485 [Micromonospora sp. HM5-17]|nr:hypothetical protein EF879_22485 [Micromonospora sp. HM5-17]
MGRCGVPGGKRGRRSRSGDRGPHLRAGGYGRRRVRRPGRLYRCRLRGYGRSGGTPVGRDARVWPDGGLRRSCRRRAVRGVRAAGRGSVARGVGRGRRVCRARPGVRGGRGVVGRGRRGLRTACGLGLRIRGLGLRAARGLGRRSALAARRRPRVLSVGLRLRCSGLGTVRKRRVALGTVRLRVRCRVGSGSVRSAPRPRDRRSRGGVGLGPGRRLVALGRLCHGVPHPGQT